jgi:hypothetical protein
MSKLPKRFAPTDLDDNNIAAGANIATSKLADGANFIKKDGSVAFTGAQSMGGNKISNLGTPSASSNDAVRMVDLENAVGGLGQLYQNKYIANAKSTANVNIANPGTAVFDTVTLTNGNWLFLADQSDLAENGIYKFTNSSTALTRIPGMDTWDEFLGALVTILEGTQGLTKWLSHATPGGTLGTDDIDFVQELSSSGLIDSDFVFEEVLTGTIDGTNATFTTSLTPATLKCMITVEGYWCIGGGDDYTRTGSTVVFNSPILVGEVPRATYIKA